MRFPSGLRLQGFASGTLLARRGLSLATGRLEEARENLPAWSATVSWGTLPNRFPDHGGQAEFDSGWLRKCSGIYPHEFRPTQERGL
jgi:hypothetical protein